MTQQLRDGRFRPVEARARAEEVREESEEGHGRVWVGRRQSHAYLARPEEEEWRKGKGDRLGSELA